MQSCTCAVSKWGYSLRMATDPNLTAPAQRDAATVAQADANPLEQAFVDTGVNSRKLARKTGIKSHKLHRLTKNPKRMTLADLAVIAPNLGRDPIDLAASVLRMAG